MIFRAESVCEKQRSGLHLPRIIGMLVTGIILGPFVLDVLDPKILGISSELRQIALIIILIKAGLSLNISDLKKVGRPAVLMSFLPALFEIGSVPFSLGLPCGKLVLSVAVLSILVTAPLGAIGMDLSYRKLLNRSRQN